jgi:hypothetical protein
MALAKRWGHFYFDPALTGKRSLSWQESVVTQRTVVEHI